MADYISVPRLRFKERSIVLVIFITKVVEIVDDIRKVILLAVPPRVIRTLIFQRYIVSGHSTGAVKG